MSRQFLPLHNGQPVDTADCPTLPLDLFCDELLARLGDGQRLAAYCGWPIGGGRLRLVALLVDREEGRLAVGFAETVGRLPSIAAAAPQAQLFEREIAEQWGATPLEHPWPKPVRFERLRGAPPGEGSTSAADPPCGRADFYRLAGDEVHEVGVGPVHAGVIEPGHFRFQCHGETVHHLEILLGYQHRGIERAMLERPPARRIHYVETAAGDTTAGHAIAYCRLVEGLCRARVPLRAQVLRGAAQELERVANHTGDLGALAGDVGYLPTAAWCGRLRGDLLNLTAVLCGNRFARGLVRPGGVAMDLNDADRRAMLERLPALRRDLESAVGLMWKAASATARFDGTGALTAKTAEELGLVGVAARACGLARDIRHELPYGIYRFAQIPVSTWDSGDVFARGYVRWLEVQRSLAFVEEQLNELPAGAVLQPCGPAAGGKFAAALVEGWRGEICHLAASGDDGRLVFYKIVDPSMHNWFGLAQAMRGAEISDFPLCNKSFNLSYCGHDL